MKFIKQIGNKTTTKELGTQKHKAITNEKPKTKEKKNKTKDLFSTNRNLVKKT